MLCQTLLSCPKSFSSGSSWHVVLLPKDVGDQERLHQRHLIVQNRQRKRRPKNSKQVIRNFKPFGGTFINYRCMLIMGVRRGMSTKSIVLNPSLLAQCMEKFSSLCLDAFIWVTSANAPPKAQYIVRRQSCLSRPYFHPPGGTCIRHVVDGEGKPKPV